jgi:hypothetical protein
MRKLLLIAVVGIGIVALLRRALPADQRVRWQENLSGVPGSVMEHCMDMMPEDSPPRVMMSTMRRIEEQNDKLAKLVRVQNKLLRKQNDLLTAAAPVAPSTD